MTTWSPGGQLLSHGDYMLAADDTSRPHGLWTFWHGNGQVWSRGNYVMGVPAGCISFWDEDGRHHTSRWSASENVFVREPCKGPTATSVADLEDELNDLRSDTVQLDITIGTLLSRGGFGVKNTSYVIGDPSLSHNAEISVRRHLRRLRLGGLIARRTSDDGGHEGWVAAATLALPIPTPQERLRFDISLALGVQRTNADLILKVDPSFRSESPLTFLGPYLALQLDSAVRAHKSLEFVVSGRLEGGIPREWETTKIFRSNTEQPIRHSENWKIGRYTLGLGLGMRISFY